MAISERTVARLIGQGGQVCTLLLAAVTPAIDAYREFVHAAPAPYALYGDGRLALPCYLEEQRVGAFLFAATATDIQAEYALYLPGNPPMEPDPDAWTVVDVRLVKGGATVHPGPLRLVGLSRPAPVLTILHLKAG